MFIGWCYFIKAGSFAQKIFHWLPQKSTGMPIILVRTGLYKSRAPGHGDSKLSAQFLRGILLESTLT